MVASIGKIASAAQGVSYFEKDGYYAREDAAHREASAWAGKGAAALGLAGPVEPEAFQSVLEGEVPGGRRLGRREIDGSVTHRPGRDVTLSAPKSVSLMAMVGGDGRIVEAHDRAVGRTLAWIEGNAVETRLRDPATGAMVRAGGQNMVAATFTHDTSRNLDPQLHTHCVVANMVQGNDGKWRTMVDDGLFHHQKAIGAIYRAELAAGLGELGYGIEKTHPDGRFEIAGVPRKVIDAYSTRRAEIEAAMAERGLGTPGENPKLADRAALMTRAAKRDVDRGELRQSWERQAADLGFAALDMAATARKRERGMAAPDLFSGATWNAADAASWAVDHLSERHAVFGHADLLAATLAREPGAVTVDAAERAIAELESEGILHTATGLDHGKHWTTDAAVARESETVALMRGGQGVEKTIMRRWVAETKLHRGRLNEGQKEAVKTVLASTDRVVGVQGYAGTGKTTMLKRLRVLAESKDYSTMGLAPSASAVRTLETESGIGSETLQRFLARHAGVIEGRGTAKGLSNLRERFARTMLVVDESSLASSEQMRGLMKAATALRIPRVVLVGDEKQLGAVEAGKPFAQLRAAGMQTAVMDDIVRQRDADLKEAVRASLSGEVRTAFAKLGERVMQVERSDLGPETALLWLNRSEEERAATGVIAPTRALRDEINAVIREGLVAEGTITGPVREGEKLVPRDLTRAEMARASNYDAGDTVIFTRPYKRLGVEKGDERRVARLEDNGHSVVLCDSRGNETLWRPYLIAGAKGGVEVYRSEAMELCAGDRVRFTRNDPASGLANGDMATVESIERDGVRFGLDDGSVKTLTNNDPQLRHMDRAFAATVHAYQGRTVDRIVAAMPSGNAQLTNQQAFYVAISRARDRAELVTDDAGRLAGQLERATGERVSALDATAGRAARRAMAVRERARQSGHGRSPPARHTADRGLHVEADRQGHGDRERRHPIERVAGVAAGTSSSGHPAEHEGLGQAEREWLGLETDGRDRHPVDGASPAKQPDRKPERDKAAEPKQKVAEIELGLEL